MAGEVDLSEQELRELENPEVACAVDALMDFMETFPETWGGPIPKTNRPAKVKVAYPKHFDSDWLSEYLKPFLSVPFFVEAPELKAWLLESGILVKNKGSKAQLNFDRLASYDIATLPQDLEKLRKQTQDSVVSRVKEERPDILEQLLSVIKQEEAQFQKTASIRQLAYKRALFWMKKNKKHLEESPAAVHDLADFLSCTTMCYVEIEYHQLLDELKHRQLVEIAPLEEGESEVGHRDEVVWHLDHLEIQPRAYRTASNFSCSRLIVMFSIMAIFLSTFLKLAGDFGFLQNKPTRP